VRIRVDNVCAETVLPSNQVPSCKNGQVNFLNYQQYLFKEPTYTLHRINAISDHDPLTSTLTIEINATPSFELFTMERTVRNRI